jgi:non-ribosomal peptide synthetase component F
LLARVKEQTLGAQLHSEIPFEQVVEIMAPARSLSHNPIFQVMFAWQNVEGVRLDLPGLSARFLTAGDRRDAKFDLTLTLGQKNDRMVGGLEYATALFEPATIRRYLGYFQTLLEGMLSGSGQAIDRLPLFSGPERHRLLYGWNATQWDYPRDKCMHELFEERVAQAPGAVAVVFEGRELTYGDLNRRANRLAHYLRERGVGPDARVGICLERSLEMAEAVMAVLKADGAYVPLDPAYPAERLKFMLEDSRPRLVLTQTHLRERIQDLSGSVQVVDLNDDEDRADRPEENLKPEGAGRDSKNLAYMIYTSGSTGRPKGVMVEHRAWANLILRHILDLLIKPGDRIMQFVSFGFDAWGEVAMTAWCGGASLYLVSSSEVAQLESLAKVIEIRAITHLFLPAPILAKLSGYAASVSAGTLTRAVTG